jgi:hypothetical protein
MLGGIPSLIFERGCIADGMVNYGIMLTIGVMSNTGSSENSDVSMALERRGGSSFGIYMRSELTIFEQGKM